MALLELIEESIIKLPLESTKKEDLIAELVGILRDNKLIKDFQGVLNAVLERESMCSTGLDKGIAVPHGKTDLVDKLTVAIGLIPSGVDFEALDGQPSKIFFLIVAPVDQSGPHIQALSEIAKISQSQDFLDRLLKVGNSKDAADLFAELAV